MARVVALCEKRVGALRQTPPAGHLDKATALDLKPLARNGLGWCKHVLYDPPPRAWIVLTPTLTGGGRPEEIRGSRGRVASVDPAARLSRPRQTRTIDVMRLLEALTARTESSPLRPTQDDPWTAGERLPDISREESASVRRQRLTRTLNVVLAALALVALLPVFVLLAILIKLTSRGPVFYLQERVGLDRRVPGPGSENHRRHQDIGGRPFTIYKFRTMHVDAERQSGAVWAVQADPRVTMVGRVLRQYRLDELPQLINVLKGEMNIVGPRPERPTIFAELRGHIAEYPLRQRAKPGITGLAQINHHYDRSLDDVRTKVSYDLEYIRRQSLREDLRIMLKTIPVILLRRGGW